MDAQQLLYHVVWPCGGSVGVLAGSLKAQLALCAAIEKILVFDHYTEISAKDPERQRRTGVGSTTFNLDLNSFLPSREALITSVACHVFSACSTWGVWCQLRAGMMASSCTMKQTSPPSAICFTPPMLFVRWSEFSAMTAKFSYCWSTGSCFCANGEVGWCCP